MSDVLTILVKSLAGGSLVVAFAVLSETLSSKRFAGSFSAAPAVAIAGLGITAARARARRRGAGASPPRDRALLVAWARRRPS